MKVTVIGTGNVGSQFARFFNTQPVPSRSLEGLPVDSDLYIISVSDAAVAEVASKLPPVDGIVVHTTGSVGMDVLKDVECGGYGVLYPFQTISRMRPLPPSSIPLLIEGCNAETTDKICSIARQFGFSHIEIADSEKRRRVHLCGTFACNFTNAMIAISQKIMAESGINADIVNPLVAETIEKLKVLPAKDAQTGPAIRKDIPTINKHLSLLRELDMEKECYIYEAVSDYIMNPLPPKSDKN